MLFPHRLPLVVSLGALLSCAGAPTPDQAEDAPPEAAASPSRAGITVTGRCVTVADCAPSRNPCTTARCVNTVCTYTVVGAPNAACNDNNPCTFNDRCVGSVCTGDLELPLLTGTQLPSTEGWVGYGGAVAATSQSGTTVRVDTLPLAPNVYATHGHALPPNVFATHDLQWELVVTSAEHNFADATAVIFPDFYGYFGASGPIGTLERQQMIYFDDTEIGWGDLSQTAAVNTHAWHVYRLHVTGTGAEVSVDGAITLTRPSISVAGANVGFGDQTNDPGLNGTFDITNVRLVPQPWCM
jgi:hypothetical protein